MDQLTNERPMYGRMDQIKAWTPPTRAYTPRVITAGLSSVSSHFSERVSVTSLSFLLRSSVAASARTDTSRAFTEEGAVVVAVFGLVLFFGFFRILDLLLLFFFGPGGEGERGIGREGRDRERGCVVSHAFVCRGSGRRGEECASGLSLPLTPNEYFRIQALTTTSCSCDVPKNGTTVRMAGEQKKSVVVGFWLFFWLWEGRRQKKNVPAT